MAKTFIQDAIDKTLKPYESSKKGFQGVNEQQIEELKENLYNMIIGNEELYKEQIDERINNIIENNKKTEIVDDIEITLHNKVPNNTVLNRKYNAGKVVGLASAIGVMLAVMTVSCGYKEQDLNEEIPTETVENVDTEEQIEEIDENKIAAEQILKDFSSKTTENTANSINSVLLNGVQLVDEDLTEEKQKDLIASQLLQYYLVANIDDITTLEYANFMKEQPGAVVDNDDLIYNFRNINVLLKGQMLVCTPDNKVDFSNIYQNELDAKLLNDGADILARLNNTTKTSDKKAISKEFYDYIENTILNQTDKLKYSNSALSTFINVEFGTWCEITKSSNYGYGYYADDELEAKIMSVVSTCGLSNGEEKNLNLEDETKKSLESINVIRVLDSLNERKENIANLISLGQLYYLDEANYSNLKTEVIKLIDLKNYKEIESFTEKKEKAIKNTKPQINKNDSQVSNGQGGTIAKDDMIANNVNPSAPNAKELYEENVKNNYKETTVVKNSEGEVIDAKVAASWAKQGAIDANSGTRNNNVPKIYQEAYNNGWNAANEAIRQAEQNVTNTTTTETVTDGKTETTVEESYEGFKESTNNNSNDIVTPSNSNIVSKPDNNSNVENKDNSNNQNNVEDSKDNSLIESKTEFVPIDDGETIVEEVEEVTGFGTAKHNDTERIIEVNTLTREKVDSYKELKSLLNEAMNFYQDAINVYDEIEVKNMSK